MVIELSPDADQNQIRAIRSALAGRFRSARELVVGGRLFITVSGDREDLDVEAIANLPGVVMVTPPDTTAFFTRREFSPDRTSAVGFGPWTIGNGDFIVIAGPCAVESEDDLLATARAGTGCAPVLSSRGQVHTISRDWACRAWRRCVPSVAGPAYRSSRKFCIRMMSRVPANSSTCSRSGPAI
jgi:hypothetical protein